jgi:hypothetical protein
VQPSNLQNVAVLPSRVNEPVTTRVANGKPATLYQISEIRRGLRPGLITQAELADLILELENPKSTEVIRALALRRMNGCRVEKGRYELKIEPTGEEADGELNYDVWVEWPKDGAAPLPASPKPERSPAYNEALQLLDTVLNNGNSVDQRAILWNLQTAASAIASRVGAR